MGEALLLLWLAFGRGDTGLIASREKEQGRIREKKKH